MSYKIAICGSMRFKHEMHDLGETLAAAGYEYEFPNLNESDEQTLADRALFLMEKASFMREHFEKISDSDAILVYNLPKDGHKGYIGANTLMEMAVAFEQGLDVFLWEPRFENGASLEVDGMQPIVLHGDLDTLYAHVEALPRCVVSTQSALKLRAVSRGLRRAKHPVRVQGIPAASGVSEQPMSVAETRQGALNRHRALDAIVDDPRVILATVESGLADLVPEAGMLGCQVVVLRFPGQGPIARVSANVEFPREMTDRVGNDYDDLGALVVAEYGQAEKDPYLPVTDGRLSRQRVLEQAVFEAAIQDG